MTRYKDKLTYTIFLFLLVGSHPLQAMQCSEATTFQDEEEHKTPENELPPVAQNLAVYDHTLHIHKEVDNEVKAKEALQEDLEDEMLPLANMLAKEANELLLAAVLEKHQDQKYYKYLFSNKGLLQEKRPVNKAYKKFRYHLMKTTSPHVIVALLEWLGWSQTQSCDNSPSYTLYSVKALHPSLSVCKNCHLLALHMFKIALPTNEKGCQGQPFTDIIETLPLFAQQYINAHLTLPLVHELIIPMMENVCASDIKQQEAAKNNTMVATIKSFPKTYTILGTLIVAGIGIFTKGLYTHFQRQSITIQNLNTTLKAQETTIEDLYAILEEKENIIGTKNQLLDKLKGQLAEKDKLVQPYYTQYISQQIIKINNQYNSSLPDVDIANGDSVKAFLQAIEIHFQPLLEIRALYAKYKGGTENNSEGWKYCWELENNKFGKRKNNEGLYWDDIYDKIEKKLKHCTQTSEKFSIFFKIIQDIDTILPNNNSRLYGVSEVLKKIRTKEETYRLEMVKFNNKLKRIDLFFGEMSRWRWLNSITN